MLLPTQSQPVQRTLVGRPFANNSASDPSGEGSEQCMRAGEHGEYGVQPSGINWGQIAGIAGPLLASLF